MADTHHAEPEMPDRQPGQSEERLRTVLNTLPVGVLMLDTRLRVVYANDHVAPIYGGITPLAEPLRQYRQGQAWLTATGEPMRDDEWPSAQALRTGMAIPAREIDILRADGSRVTVLDAAVPLRDADGEMSGVVVVVQDITELKQAEAEVRSNRAQLEAVIQSIQDGIVVADMAGHFILVNEAEALINGYPNAGAMQRDFAYYAQVYVLTELDGTPLPVDEWPLSRVLRGETFVDRELRGYRKDNGREWFFSFSGAPVRDGQGRQILAVVGTRDITERKRAEQERERLLDEVQQRSLASQQLNETLEQRVQQRTAELTQALEHAETAQARFQGLLETAPDGVVIVDAHGVITLVNHQTELLSGYLRDELLGQPVETLIPARYHDIHLQHRADFMADPRTRPMGVGLELFLRRNDGVEVPVEISLGPFQTAGGMLVTASVRDISARKRAQAEITRLNEELQRTVEGLVAANKELEAFSYSVSHDLRAPLRSIDGFSRVLAEQYPDRLDERGRDYLQRVRAAAQRMGRLIDDMLKLSRLGRVEMRREPVNMSEMAAAIIEELRQREPERQVAVTITPDLWVNGDANMLGILLDNLLGNAWKFTGKQPAARIEFATVTRDGERVFYVRDNGAGFDMTYAHKLFSPFQRLHSEEEFPGTGIGLAIAQRIVARHGGRAWAEGAEGQGATIYFTLGEAAS